MTIAIDERIDELLNEWEQYHNARVILNDATMDSTIDFRLELDDLDIQALAIYEMWVENTLTDKILENFETKLSDFRSKLTMSILQDGSIRKH